MGLFDIFKRKQMDMVTQNTQPNMNIQVEAKEVVQAPVNVPGNFVFQVEDVFSITGRGTIATGRVLKGSVMLNETVLIHEIGKSVQVGAIEQFRKALEVANEGDLVGILLYGCTRDDVVKGYHITK
jgi:translation elongation factor EF-Tu-like GTPase